MEARLRIGAALLLLGACGGPAWGQDYTLSRLLGWGGKPDAPAAAPLADMAKDRRPSPKAKPKPALKTTARRAPPQEPKSPQEPKLPHEAKPEERIVVLRARPVPIDAPAPAEPPASPSQAAPLAPSKPESRPEPKADGKSDPAIEADVKAFCGAVGTVAAEARVAWQAQRLAELEKALAERIAQFETKAAEHRDWLARREEALRRADEAVVAIYAKMRPDAAAAQLASLDDATAAAVLMKLNPRLAGTILAEIPAERAARLTEAMTGLKPPPPGEGRKTS